MVNLLDPATIFRGIELALFMLGAGSIGYMVIRLAYPEIRVFDGPVKAGYSLFTGWILVIVALILDFLAGYLIGPSVGGGLFPIMLLLCCLCGFVFLRAYILFTMPKGMELGLPISRPPGTTPKPAEPDPVFSGSQSEHKAVGEIGQQFINIMEAISRDDEKRRQGNQNKLEQRESVN